MILVDIECHQGYKLHSRQLVAPLEFSQGYDFLESPVTVTLEISQPCCFGFLGTLESAH